MSDYDPTPSPGSPGSEATDPLEAQLRQLGRDLASGTEALDEHLDAVDLAEWIDGVASPETEALVEAHLATSSESRDLVRALGSAPVLDLPSRGVAGDVVVADATHSLVRRQARQRARRRRQRWLATAVAATLLLGVGVWRGSTVDRRLSTAGVGTWSRMVADRQLLAAASAGLDAVWPQTPELETLPAPDLLAAGRPSRGRELVPELLAPRWESVRTERPTFAWTPPVGAQVREVLVLDANDQLVGRFAVDTVSPEAPDVDPADVDRSAASAPVRWSLPEGFDGLAAGATYAWKLNLESSTGETLASAYVPFQVLSKETQRTLERQLDPWWSSIPPLLRATALAQEGVYTEARLALRNVPPSPAIERLRETLRKRQHLPDSDSDSGTDTDTDTVDTSSQESGS